jgi:hypothetical protein
MKHRLVGVAAQLCLARAVCGIGGPGENVVSGCRGSGFRLTIGPYQGLLKLLFGSISMDLPS